MSERDGQPATWWRNGGDAAPLWSHIRMLETRQRTRVWRDYVNERIYGSAIGSEGAQRPPADLDQLRAGFMPADLNFTRTIVDALVARVADDRPAIRHATDNASWGQRRKARQLDQVIEGEIEALKLPAKSALVVRDSLVTRGGVMWVEADSGCIVADRVPCEELYFDEREARYGEPRQLHRVFTVSREVLAEKFPEHRGAIMAAPPPQPKLNDFERDAAYHSGMIEVAKSYHLPSGKDASDGKRVLSIPGAVLDEGPWERDHFPAAILRWSPPRRGFWGASLVDDLAGLQYKVNEVARDLMRNIYFTSAVKVAVRRGANVSKKHASGKRPHFIEVDAIGSDLQWLAPDGFSPAQFQFLQWLIQQMFEVSGVSQLMAQGKNTLGAGASGAALNEVWVQDSERFSQFTNAIAAYWRDVARLIVEAARDLADDEGFRDSEVKVARGSLVQRIKWKDVDLDADRYEMHLEASGYLPSTRAGKMQGIEQLIANNMIDPKWATSLIDYPDLKKAMMVENAPVEVALWAMEELEDVELDDDGEVIAAKSRPIPAPDPHFDLEFLMQVTKAVYGIKVTEEAPAAVLGRFVDFMDAIDLQQRKLAGAGAPQPPAGGGPADPMAAAMPPAAPAPVDPMAAMAPPVPMGGM